MRSISYRRGFRCDKSISKGIKQLNKMGFYTVGCCSGLNSEHDSERDRLYVAFENLKHTKNYTIRIIAEELGFEVRDNRKESLRIQSTMHNKLKMFYLFVARIRKSPDLLNLRTMGISNWAKNTEDDKLYSIQFYDYDFHNGSNISKEELDRILEIFPLDCLMYGTKHGLHFISFALRMGLRYTKAKAVETSKQLGAQDYWTEAKDLTLRISQKWKVTGRKKKRQIISKKPKFKGLIKSPDKNIISGKHLEFYFKYMDLPMWVYEKYSGCDKRDYKIKVSHYKTRD